MQNEQPTPQATTNLTPSNIEENPNKNYLLVLLLSWLAGILGVDRFYLGKIGTGIAKLLTLGGFGIWAWVDFIMLAFGSLRAANDNRPLDGYAKNNHWVKIVTIVLFALSVLVLVFAGLIILVGIASSTSS